MRHLLSNHLLKGAAARGAKGLGGGLSQVGVTWQTHEIDLRGFYKTLPQKRTADARQLP